MKTIPVELSKALKRIRDAVNIYNARFGRGDAQTLIVMSVADKRTECTKAMSFSQQFEQDISAIALHEEFGFGAERLHRYHDKVIAVAREFDALRASTKGDDEDLWEYTDKFERRLKAAWGDELYLPRAERYRAVIYYDGVKSGEINIAEDDEEMIALKGVAKTNASR